MSTFLWFSRIILCHVFLLISCSLQAQDQNNTDSKSVEIDDISDIMLPLITNQNRFSKKEMKKPRSKDERQSENENSSNDFIKTNQRLTREKPKDGIYEKVQLIDLTQRKVNRLKRQLTTHQAKGKTVYVKKEVVTKINRLQHEEIVNVNVADTAVLSLAVAENKLKDERSSEASDKKDGDGSTSDSSLATFAVGSQNTSANHLYRITKDGNYQYQDGKEIVGSEKSDEWFEDGYKPITETTFYYDIAEQPHIDLKQENVGSFTSMSVEEQVKLIKESIEKSSDYIELDELEQSKKSVLGKNKEN